MNLVLRDPIFHDVQQNEDEWLQMRTSKLTSSKLGVVMATPADYKILEISKGEFAIADTKANRLLKYRFATKIQASAELEMMKRKDLGKSFGAPARQYAIQLAIEQITGVAASSNYSNEHMERGHQQEPLARMAYEDHMFCDVTNGGFFDLGFVGCSPDGVVGPGLIEIKSVIEHVHYANVARCNVDPAYKWQCIGNMKFTNSEWIDFISYCDTYPDDKKLFIYRMQKSDYVKEYDMIDSRIAEFYTLVNEAKAKILNSSYTN